MNTQITLSDIKTTILNLKYKNINSPKYKFLNTLTQFFVNDISFSTINTIDSEILVKKIWNTGDNPRLIKAKLKNLNSVRSSINKDLNKLYKENQNPQGVNINTSNVFVMSNEAKNNLMDKFSDKMGSGSIDEIYNVLDLVNEIISKLDNNKINDSKNKLDKLRELINNISKDTPDNDKGTDTELIDDEDVEVVDDEGAELIDDEDVEVVDDEGAELIDDDDIEVVDDVDTELIDDEDVEVVDDEGAELIDDEDIDVVDDEETELIDDDDVEVVDDEETELIDDDNVEVVDDEDTELIDDDDIEVVDDEETELIDDDDIEVVDDEGAELIDDDDIEVVDDEETELIDDEDIEVVDDEETELIEDEDTELIDDDDIEIVEDEDIDVVDDVDTELIDDEDIEVVDDEETELIDDDNVEVVDDVDTELIDDDDIEVVDDVDTELIDNDDIEVVDDVETELIDDEDTELIDDDDIEVVDDEETELIDDDDVEVVDDVDTELIDDEDIEIVDDVDTELIDDDDVEVVDDDEDTDSKALAEEFDHELSIKERYYNQYILMDKDEYIIGSEIPDKNYLPLQKIRLDKFYIGKYPVTNALFETFIERTGYKTTAEKKGYGIVYSGRFKKSINEKTGQKESVWSSSYRQKTVEGACWYKPSGQNSTIHNKRDHPVVQISLKDAIAFCTWTGKKLPTEFEWEASARTKLGYMLPWGNTWKKDMCNIEESAFSDTTPVDKYSNIEIFSSISDSLGNVLEWTSDECISNYKTKRTFIYHIAKGGSWISQNNICLCSRFNIRTDLTSNILGFRCVIN